MERTKEQQLKFRTLLHALQGDGDALDRLMPTPEGSAPAAPLSDASLESFREEPTRPSGPKPLAEEQSEPLPDGEP